MNQKQKEYNREYRERRYREEYKPAYDAFIPLYPFTLDDLPDERWLPIPNYEDYHVSNFGRVKSFNGRWVKVTILKPDASKGGYLRVTLFKDGKHKHFQIARLVALTFIPNPEGKPEVNHIDGIKFNNHVSNLEWATAAENSQHAFASGLATVAKGCDDSQSLFKDEADIIYIRDNPDRLTGKELAEMFNTTQQKISEIQIGKKYKTEGGTIREPFKGLLSPEEKAEIRRLYVPYSRKFGTPALARIFNCGRETIRKIVNAKDEK